MSDLANLQIKVTADVKTLQAEMAKGVTSVKDFAAQTATSLNKSGQAVNTLGLTMKQSIALYNSKIAESRGTTVAVGEASVGAFTKIGVGATKALSLVRNLAYILPGVGVAGIIGFATEPIIKYVSSLFEASKATKELEERTQSIKKAGQAIFENAGKEAAEVSSLIVVLKSETETRQRKLEALQELKKINPDIFNGLQLEHGAVVGLDQAYKNYLANLRIVIAAKVTQAKLEDAITRQLEAQGITQNKSTRSLIAGFKSINAERAKGLKELGVQDGNNPFKQLQDNLDKVQDGKLKSIQFEIDGLLKDLGEFSKGVTLDPLKGAGDKAKKEKDTIDDVLKKLSAEFDVFNKKQITGEFGDQVPAKISAILSTVDRLFKDFNVAPDDTLIAKLLGTNGSGNQVGLPANIPGVEGLKRQIQTAVQDEVNRGPIEITVPIKPKIEIDPASLGKIAKTVELEFSGILQSVATNIGVGFGETLGKALAGASNIGDFFTGIFKSIGQGLKQLGTYFIEAALKVLIVKKFITSQPYLALAAGAALVALGAAMSARLAKTPGLYTGAKNFRGGVALVGERGPELVNLPQGSDVIPNHELGSMNGGIREVPYIASTVVEGQNLRLVLRRADATYGRNA